MKSIAPLIAALSAAFAAANLSAADIETRDHPYKHGDTALEGFVATPELADGEKRPGILLIHDWTGLQDYAKERAKMLAELGYITFAADVYGTGVRPETPQECGVQAGKYKGDRTLFRARMNAALDQLKALPGVDPDRLGAIGYCFGGTGVIELARSGADVKGVVSFHGGLDSPSPEDGANIKAKVLALHGAADPHVPQEDLHAFAAEMEQHGVDWQLVAYGGAVHSFTKKAAGDDPSKGAAYDEKADQRSWAHMRLFFDELFAK
ncbi:MAG: dienelactone hydrolase family protein [Verrucomicrobiales bacterium]